MWPGQRRRCGLQAQLAARRADPRQTAANRVLTRDKSCPIGDARRLRIVIAEHDAFTTDAVDVGPTADVGRCPCSMRGSQHRECDRAQRLERASATCADHIPPVVR
jgi:hypothetical protein